MTQAEQVAAVLGDIPGSTAEWDALARRLDLLRRHADPAYRGRERDGSVDEAAWKHLRNIARVVGEMSRSFAALERGDDPDTYAMFGVTPPCPRCRKWTDPPAPLCPRCNQPNDIPYDDDIPF